MTPPDSRRSESPSRPAGLRRLLRRVDPTGSTVDRAAVEEAAQNFVSRVGTSGVELRWVPDLVSGRVEADSLNEKLRGSDLRTWEVLWRPMIDHHWPWGGRSEFKPLLKPGDSDLPSPAARTRSSIDEFDDALYRELTRPMGWFELSQSGMHLAAHVAQWALWSAMAFSRVRPPLPDDLRGRLGVLWQNQDAEGRRLFQQHSQYHSRLLNLELREAMVCAYAAGLFSFFSLYDRERDLVTMILVPRPQVFLEEGVPHRWDAPAVIWEGGTSYWMWRGVLISPAIVEREGEVTMDDILSTTDQRRRAAYIERFGRRRYREDAKKLPTEARRRRTFKDVVFAALEAAADEIEHAAGVAPAGIAYDGAVPDTDAGARRLGIPADEPLSDDDGEFEWEPWFERQRQTTVLASVHKEPRGGMLTYGGTVAALTLPSGRRIYAQWGDMQESEVVAVAPAASEGDPDLRFLQWLVQNASWLDIPVSFSGDDLFQIDLLWTAAERLEWIRDALYEPEADWMDSWLIEKGGERQAELIERLEQVLEGTQSAADRYQQEYEGVLSAPPWFFLLGEEALEGIGSLSRPRSDRSVPLVHRFTAWRRPTPAIFRDPSNPANLQHIVAAFQRLK